MGQIKVATGSMMPALTSLAWCAELGRHTPSMGFLPELQSLQPFLQKKAMHPLKERHPKNHGLELFLRVKVVVDKKVGGLSLMGEAQRDAAAIEVGTCDPESSKLKAFLFVCLLFCFVALFSQTEIIS